MASTSVIRYTKEQLVQLRPEHALPPPDFGDFEDRDMVVSAKPLLPSNATPLTDEEKHWLTKELTKPRPNPQSRHGDGEGAGAAGAGGRGTTTARMLTYSTAHKHKHRLAQHVHSRGTRRRTKRRPSGAWGRAQRGASKGRRGRLA